MTTSDLDKVAGGTGRPLEVDHVSMEPDSLLGLSGVDGSELTKAGEALAKNSPSEEKVKAEMASPVEPEKNAHSQEESALGIKSSAT